MTLNDLGAEIYQNAVDKGFYEQIHTILAKLNPEEVTFVKNLWMSNRLMLITSELAEGLEGIRAGNLSAEPKSGGLGEELADAAIRLFDMFIDCGINPDEAIRAKMNFNKNRLKKHGNKAL